MNRLMLTDELWSRLRIIMRQFGVYDKPNLRMIVQFNRWSSKNKLMKIFKTLVEDPDLEWEFIDGSIVKAHQHSTGATSDKDEVIGKSVAGNTTKIHMAVDAYGLPIDFEITGGEVHDCKVAPEFFSKLPDANYMIADKGYDSEELRDLIRSKSAIPVIPRKSNSKTGNDDMD